MAKKVAAGAKQTKRAKPEKRRASSVQPRHGGMTALEWLEGIKDSVDGLKSELGDLGTKLGHIEDTLETKLGEVVDAIKQARGEG
jgi:hypothetical protein